MLTGPALLFFLSIGLQLAAALLALRLIRITGRKGAWILISLAMLMIAVRRTVTFASMLSAGAVRFDTAEWVALGVSVLMLAGVLRIPAYFRTIQTAEEGRAQMFQALRAASAEISAETGERFFRFLTEHLTKTLGMDYAMVGRLTGKEPESVRTLAVSFRGENRENVEYALDGTPCENVVRQGICAYPRGVQGSFPADRMLVEMGAECYMGAPLRDSAGRTLGLMAVLDSQPPEDVEFAETVFHVFAARAAAELERIQAQEKIERDYHAQRVVRSVLEVAQRPVPLKEQLEEALEIVFSVPSLNVQSRGCIFLAEDGSGVLSMAAHRGLGEPLLSTCARVPFGRCLCGKAAEERRIVFASRVDSGHEVTFDGMDPHGHLCVPILAGSRTLGVLNLYVEEGHGWTAEEEDLLGTVARTLAGVIERRQAEAALRESEENFRALAENALDGIVIATAEGRLAYANRRLGEIMGGAVEEFVGRPISELVPPEDFARIMQNLKNRLEGKPAPRQYEVTGIRKNGERVPIEISASRTAWEGRPASLAIIRDVSERKRIEEERLRASKLEYVGVLAGGIAHDFNNLLTAITGNVSLSKAMVEPGGEIHEQLEEAEKACVRARDLTHQLLTFSRGGAPVKKAASIGDLVRESVSFALSGAGTDADFEIPPDLWAVEVDEGQMSRVIQNLVLNASQAMSQSGTVRIRCENVRLDGEEREPGVSLPPGKYVRISVQDSGAGIAPENLQRIFEPYFTTKRKGTGLGLAATYSIVRNHGGQIGVESVLGRGTTFTIYLPASEEAPARKEAGERRPAPTGSGRVLVVDDEDLIRNLAVRVLEQGGYAVSSASEGAEAVEFYRSARASGRPFDLVITDLTIPGGMGGREVALRLREIDPDARIIVSSSYSEDAAMADFKAHGFCGVVAKPYKMDELLLAVEQALGRSG